MRGPSFPTKVRSAPASESNDGEEEEATDAEQVECVRCGATVDADEAPEGTCAEGTRQDSEHDWVAANE